MTSAPTPVNDFATGNRNGPVPDTSTRRPIAMRSVRASVWAAPAARKIGLIDGCGDVDLLVARQRLQQVDALFDRG